MKQKGSKEKLKPISLYGLNPRDVIRAIMQVSPDRLKDLEEQERPEPEEDNKSEQATMNIEVR